MTVTFTRYVGISPGTTTMQLGFPSVINVNGIPSIMPLNGIPSIMPLNGLGVCPPGHYGPAVMLPGSAPPPQPMGNELAGLGLHPVYYNPYGTESRLKGLGALPTLRWDLFVLALGAGFAGWLGYSWWKRRK
jgi:hypothetical protein